MINTDAIRASMNAHPEDRLDRETTLALLNRLDLAEAGWDKTSHYAESLNRRCDRAEWRIYAARSVLQEAILRGGPPERELAQRIRRALES